MRNAAISELKATLSEILTHVKAGEEVVVTERGKPIAKIMPFSPKGERTSSHLVELARAGLIRLGSGKVPKGFWKHPRPQDPKGLGLQFLLQERAEDR